MLDPYWSRHAIKVYPTKCVHRLCLRHHIKHDLVTRHVDRDLTTLGNRLSNFINPIHVVWVKMWFSFETHLLKNCLNNDVRSTIPIYQLIILSLMCNIGVEHTRSTPALISNSYVWTPNYTQLDARNSNILISITLAPNWLITYRLEPSSSESVLLTKGS